LKRSNRLILLIGVFLAVVAFVLIVLLLSSNGGGGGGSGTPPSPSPISTVIAAKDIALGVTITEDMLTTQTLAPAQRLPGAFQVPSQVVGQIARQEVTSGEQITTATLSTQGQSIKVPPGQRAMSVQVDAVSGVGTAIQTGDYVDLIVGLTGDAFPVVQLNPQDNSIQVVAGLNNTSVKLILEGMQVLGTVQPQPTTNNNQSTPQPSGSPTPRNPELSQDTQELVVLSVTAQQAEVIKFAQMQGNISLVLRSPKDFFDENGQPVLPVPAGTTGVILKTLVDGGYGVLRPELVEAILPAQ
jgi:Flp pilus assembly protein CpaB